MEEPNIFYLILKNNLTLLDWRHGFCCHVSSWDKRRGSGWRRGPWRERKSQKEEMDARPGVPLWLWKGGFSSHALAVCCHHFPCASTVWRHACLKARIFPCPPYSAQESLGAGARNRTKMCYRWLLLKKVRMSPISAENVLGNFSPDRLSVCHTLQGCMWNDWPELCTVCRRTDSCPCFPGLWLQAVFVHLWAIELFTSVGLLYLFLVVFHMGPG